MPKSLPLVKIPTPSLRERSVDVHPKTIGTPEFQTFLDNLTETMFVENGVGIAAPQVGRNERIIIVKDQSDATAYINPTVELLTDLDVESEEGCLSVPGVYGIVKRAKQVKVTALNRHARTVSMLVKGFQAVVFQHEADHLNGILFVDKVERYTKGSENLRV